MMSKHKSKKWFNSLAGLVLGTCTLFSLPANGQFFPPYSLFQRSTSLQGPLESEDLLSVTDRLDIHEELKTFAAVWEQADIMSQMARNQFLTVFAPTNEAMNSLSMQELLRSGNPEELAKFVRNHIVLGEIDQALIAEGGGEVETLGGSKIKIQVNPYVGDVVINDVIKLNYSRGKNKPITAIDGVILRIDRPLLSPSNIDYNIRSDSKNTSEEARLVTVENKSGENVVALYVESSGSREWGENELGNETMGNGQYITTNLTRNCMYDIKAVLANGRTIEQRQVDSCSNNYISLSSPEATAPPPAPAVPQAVPQAPPQQSFSYGTQGRSGSAQFYCDNNSSIPETRYRTATGETETWISWSSNFFSGSGYDPRSRCEAVSSRLENYRSNGQLNYIGIGRMNGYPVICAAVEYGECGGLIYTLKPSQNAQRTLDKFLQLRRGDAGVSSLFESEDEEQFIDVRPFLQEEQPHQNSGELRPL